MDFQSWYSQHVESPTPEIKESWEGLFKKAFDCFYSSQKLSGYFLLEEVFEGESVHDYFFWIERAIKREEARCCLYLPKDDLFSGKKIYWSQMEKSAFLRKEKLAELPLTPSGKYKALFLDRDGIINEDLEYVYEPAKVSFVPGVEKLISYCNSQGILVFVLTNQSGVGRGYYKEDDVLLLHQWMGRELEKKGAKVNGWYYSPYHPESLDQKYKKVSLTRKPKPGMALKAAYDHNISLRTSAMIGDKVSDILSHVDVFTVLFRGNYELGAFEPIVHNHEESLEVIKKYFEGNFL